MPERGGLCPFAYGRPCKEAYCMAWRPEGYSYEPCLRLDTQLRIALALETMGYPQ